MTRSSWTGPVRCLTRPALTLKATILTAVTLTVAGCASSEALVQKNYTFPPFKVGMAQERVGGVLLVERFREGEAAGWAAQAREQKLYLPPASYPLLDGLPPMNFGPEFAPVQNLAGRPNFAFTETTSLDVQSRYIGYALRNSGLFDEVRIEANEDEEAASEDGATGGTEPDYRLRAVVHLDHHTVNSSAVPFSIALMRLFGFYANAASTLTHHKLGFDFEVVDRSGQPVLRLPLRIKNRFGMDRQTTKPATITELEWVLNGYREALSIAADYLIENLSERL